MDIIPVTRRVGVECKGNWAGDNTEGMMVMGRVRSCKLVRLVHHNRRYPVYIHMYMARLMTFKFFPL